MPATETIIKITTTAVKSFFNKFMTDVVVCPNPDLI